MRFYILLFLAIFLIGCGTAENSNTAVNTNATGANAAIAKANNPLATTKTPEISTTNNALTLAPVVENYYAALNAKNEAGTKKFLSQTAIKYWEDEAKAEKKTSFAYLLEAEEPLAEKREIRNEKIEDNTAVAEIKGGSLGVWTPVKFVKENGEWKFASPKDNLALQDLPRNSMSANSAK
jgi:hypothetical protein